MHPFESFLFFSYALFPLLFAAHPIAFLYIKTNLIVAALLGHSGFEFPAQGSKPHYLHHLLLDVNYAETTFPPIDTFFNTFAGSEAEAEISMKRRGLLVSHDGSGGGGGDKTD